MPRSKLSVFFSLMLVFFSGSVLGAFAYRLYTVNTVVTAPPQKRSPEEFLRDRMAEMHDRVKTDDQQLEQIKRVYNDTREEFDLIRKKMGEEGRRVNEDQVAKIKAILRPEQIPIYDQIRAEHEAAHKRRMQDREREGKKQ